MVKNLVANARDVRGLSSIPGSGRSPRGGHDKPLVFFPMDKGAWWATVPGVTELDTTEAT